MDATVLQTVPSGTSNLKLIKTSLLQAFCLYSMTRSKDSRANLGLPTLNKPSVSVQPMSVRLHYLNRK